MGTSQGNTPNFLKVTQMVANMTLAQVKNNMVMLPKVNRRFDPDFGKKGEKIGDSIDVRIPLQFQGSRGPNLNVEGMQAPTVPVKISTQYVVGMEYSSYEQLLSLDFLKERAVNPAMLTICNSVDSDLLSLATQFPGTVGVPGSAVYTRNIISAATSVLDNNAVPVKGMKRYMVTNSDTEQAFKNANTTLFNKQTTLGAQFDTGRMDVQDGFEWSMDQNVASFTAGPQGGSPVVFGANQVGNAIVVHGWTAAVALRLKQGDSISFDGSFKVNPVNNANSTKNVLNTLKQFVLTADANSDVTGATTLMIDPPIQVTGAYQNVSASPTNGGVVHVNTGTASAVSPVNFAFCPDALCFVGAKLPDVSAEGAACSFARDPDLGLEIRVSTQWNIMSDIKVMRIETLGGCNVLRRDFGVRVQV